MVYGPSVGTPEPFWYQGPRWDLSSAIGASPERDTEPEAGRVVAAWTVYGAVETLVSP